MKIFISHESHDAALAQAWQDLLKGATVPPFSIWRSTDNQPAGGIPPGAQFYKEICARLEESDCVIALITRRSRGNAWVNWECGVAHQGTVIPVCYEIAPSETDGPFQVLQAFDGADQGRVVELVRKIADSAGAKVDERALDVWMQQYLKAVESYAAAHPFVDNLHRIVREYHGEPHSNDDGGIVVLHANLAEYSAILRKLFHGLRDEGALECRIYNTLQPQAYLHEYQLEEREGQASEAARGVTTERLLKGLDQLTPEELESYRERLVRLSADTFPSIRLIESVFSANPECCARYTLLTEECTRQELWFLDALMGASDAHFIVPESRARRAFGREKAPQSDFCVWENEGITVSTDYYEGGETLVIAWSLQDRKPSRGFLPRYMERFVTSFRRLHDENPETIHRYMEHV